MNYKYFEIMPDDMINYILGYYMIGLRHRTNLRKLKELIQFTHGEPQMILSPEMD
tara:strand:- start:142 stop:306 length:165 start_codon:yes stop_codon:yes gene_type:complete